MKYLFSLVVTPLKRILESPIQMTAAPILSSQFFLAEMNLQPSNNPNALGSSYQNSLFHVRACTHMRAHAAWMSACLRVLL